MAEIRVPIQVNLPDDWVDQIVNRLRNDPEAEWVEVTRCKDCKYGDTFHKFDEPDMPMKCLGQHYGGTYPDDFCSYAERREE